MRIALYHNLPSGGAKRALYEQTRRLSERHEIDVYTLSSADHSFCDIQPFVNSYRRFSFRPGPHFPHPFGLFDHGVRAADIFRLRSVQRAIAEEINRSGCDVALLHIDHYTQSPIVLRFLKVPSVYYCHEALRTVYDPPIPRPYLQLTGLPYWADRFNPLRPWYLSTVAREDKASLRSATVVLVNSYFSRETVYRLYGISPQVCYLGIDIRTFRPLGLEKGNYVISIGSVTPPKGFDFIIRSLTLIPEQQRPPLLIVGNFVRHDEQNYLEDLARRNNVLVEFRSLIKDSELVELYNRARITLYAPTLEPFGLVPLESMACGTPVIGVAEGGVRETVRHGETGLLTDRVPKQFADAVRKLLINPSFSDELGKRGPGYVQDCWNWDDSVARLELYLKSLGSGDSQ